MPFVSIIHSLSVSQGFVYVELSHSGVDSRPGRTEDYALTRRAA